MRRSRDDNTRADSPNCSLGCQLLPRINSSVYQTVPQSCRRGDSQKQELLDGRPTYWFLGAGRWAEVHRSLAQEGGTSPAAPRREHRLCGFLAWTLRKKKPMFSIVRGLSESGEHTVSETRNPGREAASDAGTRPACRSACPTVPQTQKAHGAAARLPAHQPALASTQHCAGGCEGQPRGVGRRAHSRGPPSGRAGPTLKGMGGHQTASGISAEHVLELLEF